MSRYQSRADAQPGETGVAATQGVKHPLRATVSPKEINQHAIKMTPL